MLTRADAGPGSVWMSRLSAAAQRLTQGTAVPARRRRWPWVLLAFFFVAVFGIWPLFRHPIPPPAPVARPFESSARIGGVPLLAYGDEARGVIAVGSRRATGLVAVGGIAVGVIAIGGVALGGITLGGLSVGVFALGGGALGWWAVGGGAAGYYALGGLAVGGYAYAGNGVALGYHLASGAQREALIG